VYTGPTANNNTPSNPGESILSLATTASANQLDIFKSAGLQTSNYDDAAFEAVATANSYLPRLTQFTDASAVVKKREVQVGFYLVAGKDDRTPLGEDVDVVPISWRFKALDTSAGKPVSSIDPNSDLFKSIAARAKSNNSSCQAGIEFLVWIPAVAKFGTYLMGSKTALKEAAKLKPLLGCPVTIKTFPYDNGVNIWQGPKVLEASVPPTVLPDPQILADTNQKFLNPPADDAQEPVEEVKAEGKRRAR
jgi:hypothetical protein